MVRNMDIATNLVPADSLLGYDTVAPYGSTLKSAVKWYWRCIWHRKMAIEQETLFVSDFHGLRSTSRTDSRIQTWIQKPQKQGNVQHLLQKTANRRSICENVKRAILQTMIWHFCNESQSSRCRFNFSQMDEYGETGPCCSCFTR